MGDRHGVLGTPNPLMNTGEAHAPAGQHCLLSSPKHGCENEVDADTQAHAYTRTSQSESKIQLNLH